MALDTSLSDDCTQLSHSESLPARGDRADKAQVAQYGRQTTSFIENSIEAGILLGGNGSVR